MSNNKLISIIIVNWNGKKWLHDCLQSIFYQTYKDFEVVFVDNASSDDSVAYVTKTFPKVRIIQSIDNSGFSGGNNLGYKNAKGNYILLLNNDTKLEKNYLNNFIKAFAEIPNLGIVQSKIILMNDPKKLDMVGAYWTDMTFLYHYGYGKSEKLKKYNTPMPFFSNKGASIMIRRSLIEKLGLFDDDFWCYYEDTDLCHKAWLAGYECWYYPNAVVYHAMGGTSLRFDNSFIQFHNFKNKLLSFLKNFEVTSLLTILPIYFVINVCLSFMWLFQGKYKHFLSLYKSIWWNIVNFDNTMEKRKKIQRHRKLSDVQIFKKVKKNPRLSYYYYLFRGGREGGLENYID